MGMKAENFKYLKTWANNLFGMTVVYWSTTLVHFGLLDCQKIYTDSWSPEDETFGDSLYLSFSLLEAVHLHS